ncbi:zinc ribbon domain-containing protein [Paenibacillus dokdonensis]|uniref:Zinc ribbon domain-containing protein n=1 Tax=Paenibacillus dokdonensis TaxID=2567944 RepID=A0ABU6GGP3_9BACL|nr:zinc ribbon domain-containing protein [Paenibacillus dokdonensis]MEC0238905.1 zinc ribbon domain-containing protein [Paenibacillus dokdonensis]
MSVKICPHCGASNPEAAEICGVCGASLEQVRTVQTLKSSTHPDTEDEKIEASTSHEYSQPITRFSILSGSGGLMTMLLIATILYPFVGMIVGGVIAFSEDKDKRETGKFILLVSLIIWAIRVVFIPLLSH